MAAKKTEKEKEKQNSLVFGSEWCLGIESNKPEFKFRLGHLLLFNLGLADHQYVWDSFVFIYQMEIVIKIWKCSYED